MTGIEDAEGAFYTDVRSSFEMAMQAEGIDPTSIVIILNTVDDYVGNHYDVSPSEVTPHCDICSKPEDQDPTNGREYDWNGETGCHLSCEETLVGILKTGVDYSDAVAMVRSGPR